MITAPPRTRSPCRSSSPASPASPATTRFDYFRARYPGQVIAIRQEDNWPLTGDGIIPCNAEDHRPAAGAVRRVPIPLGPQLRRQLRPARLRARFPPRLAHERRRADQPALDHRRTRRPPGAPLDRPGVSPATDTISAPRSPLPAPRYTRIRPHRPRHRLRQDDGRRRAAPRRLDARRPASSASRCRWASASTATPARSTGFNRASRKAARPRSTSTKSARPPTPIASTASTSACWPATSPASTTPAARAPLSLYQIAQVINRVGGYDPNLLMGCPRIEAGPIPPRAGDVTMNSTRPRRRTRRRAARPLAARPGLRPHAPRLAPRTQRRTPAPANSSPASSTAIPRRQLWYHRS